MKSYRQQNEAYTKTNAKTTNTFVVFTAPYKVPANMRSLPQYDLLIFIQFQNISLTYYSNNDLLYNVYFILKTNMNIVLNQSRAVFQSMHCFKTIWKAFCKWSIIVFQEEDNLNVFPLRISGNSVVQSFDKR